MDAAAFQLAALLERYEEHVGQLASTWLDTSVYAQVCREVDEMRLLCAGLPLLSVAWVHLLISNTELMHCLSACTPSAKQSPAAQRCQAKHLVAIRALRAECLGYFSRVERSH